MKVDKNKSYVVTCKTCSGWYHDIYLVRGQHLQIQNGNFGFTNAYKITPRDHMSMLSIVNEYMDKLKRVDYYVIDEKINYEIFKSYIRIEEVPKTAIFVETKEEMVKELVKQTIDYVGKFLNNVLASSEYQADLKRHWIFRRFTASHKLRNQLQNELLDLYTIQLENKY